MDKTAIKNFAIEARKILRKSAITEAGFYGITKDAIKDPVQKNRDFEVYETAAGTENRIYKEDIKRRANLVDAVRTMGFDQVIEETAYTWFNRIIAIRFMEVNNYLPTRVRVLSSETGNITPDIITQSDTVDLNLTDDEQEKIRTAKRENRYDDAFRILFVKQCNELNTILPGLFEKTDDYMELLLKISYTGDGVVRMLIDSIPEDNFNVETEGQVEIIGWMYQYYNTELKDDTFAKLKKNVKITKERIPAVTQLFTPDWIVRYMVENSLGRVWIEHLRAVDPIVDEKAKAEEFGWKYYLPEEKQEDDVNAQLVEIRKSYKDMSPQDITCIDPCMGSGHILVYMFDVLMDIYRSEGFSEREAVFEILEKNIRGLDIDRRAYQLSYFALMMKARGYNRIFFRGHEDAEGNKIKVSPKVYAIEESNFVDREQLKYFGANLDENSRNNAMNQMTGLLDVLYDAKEYGSILNVDNYDWGLLRDFIDKVKDNGQMSLFSYDAKKSKQQFLKLIDIGEVLAKKYEAVITNPPYFGNGTMNLKLTTYLKEKYADSKVDLYATFIQRCSVFTSKLGYQAMITQHGWMFLSSFERLREIISLRNTVNMCHLGPRAFDEISGEVVQTTAFVKRSSYINKYKGTYLRLLSGKSEEEKKQQALSAAVDHAQNYFEATENGFDKIPGKPIAYWISDNMIESFEKNKTLGELANPKSGMSTTDNARFLKGWFEVEFGKIGFGYGSITATEDGKYKWFPYNKGGNYRKWYGNREYICDWENNGAEMKYFVTHNPKDPNTKSWSRRIFNTEYSFRESLTWSALSNQFSIRYCEQGFMFDSKGASCFPSNNLFYILAYLNSKVASEFLKVLCPTLDFNPGQVGKLPIVENHKWDDRINQLCRECIELTKEDWDAFETSWNFEMHPFVKIQKSYQDGALAMANVAHYYDEGQFSNNPIEACYLLWDNRCKNRIKTLKTNEEEINRIFIDIYGLNEELDPSVDDKDISIRNADLQREIKSLISYAVGCMFGRYSLDEPGLIYAGGDYNKDVYKSFFADDDAIIPITDEKYFDDDIVGRFEEFIKVVYGQDYLEDNLKYIADALGTKGNTSRESIRNYFLNDFYKDHCNTYSVSGTGKRPIYWLFDSGKQNGFKCLIYIHRYTQDTMGLIRSDYLTKTQAMIENALKNAEYIISTSSSAVDKAQATKKRDKYLKQLAEIRAYYPALSHIALQRINLNLDDGVKENYEKFQGVEVSIEGEKKQSIDLLAKI